MQLLFERLEMHRSNSRKLLTVCFYRHYGLSKEREPVIITAMQAPLKASGWWNYKIPPMLAVAYYAIASASNPPGFGAMKWYFLLYIVSTVGIAGFGHVLLDVFDVEEDRVLGKQNLWAPLSPASRVLLIGALLMASWLPWLVLPAGPLIVGILSLQFLMFFLYAVPPVRLKERGFPGIVADAMYAHMLPALWTLIPFSVLAGSTSTLWFYVLLAAWSLAVGMRHLLQHQVLQVESDHVAGARTFAVRYGRERTLALMVRRVMPAEVVAFTLLLLSMAGQLPGILLGFGLYLLWQGFRFRRIWMSRFNIAGRMYDADRATVAGTLIMSRFYERWLPVMMLIVLVSRDRSWIVLLGLHVIVFRRAFVEIFHEEVLLAAAYVRSLTSQLA